MKYTHGWRETLKYAFIFMNEPERKPSEAGQISGRHNLLRGVWEEEELGQIVSRWGEA